MQSCPLDDILHDLNVIKEAEKLALFLNNSKSEIICVDAVASQRHNYHCTTWCRSGRSCKCSPLGISHRWFGISHRWFGIHQYFFRWEDQSPQYHEWVFCSLLSPWLTCLVAVLICNSKTSLTTPCFLSGHLEEYDSVCVPFLALSFGPGWEGLATGITAY